MEDHKLNDSLVDMEKHIQGILPAMSPAKKGSRKISSFRRGPSSVDLLRQETSSSNKKPKKRVHLSKCGIAFLVIALVQAVVIAGLQISIAVLGDFNGGQLEEYLPCVMEGYEASNMTLPANSTFPSFGKDKEIYIYIFIFIVVYNFGLCLYALIAQRIVEVGSFVAINFLLVIYGSIQVYQFRGFSESCDSITKVGWIAMGNVFAVLIFNVMFCFLAVQIYVEFGWKLYKFVNCNPALRFYYRNYEIFLSVLKATIVFTIAFLAGQAALILRQDDYEFWMSFPFIIGMILLYFFSFFMVRRESHISFMALLVIGLLLMSYDGFKVYRYVTRSCPVCRELVAQQLDERREDFQHLAMMACLNMAITLLFMFTLIRVWLQFGKGLADHFYIHGFWFDRILRKNPPEDAYFSSVGTGKMMKQQSGTLLRIRQLELSTEFTRNSSLDEKDYTDYVFTPSTEYKSLGLMPSSPINKLTDRLDVGRTFSLPPILEHKGK